MPENAFLTNPTGEWRHLVTKCKKFFHNFFPFLHKHNTEERLKKYSAEKSYHPLKIARHFLFPTPF
jgi:hypothetical protein